MAPGRGGCEACSAVETYIQETTDAVLQRLPEALRMLLPVATELGEAVSTLVQDMNSLHHTSFPEWISTCEDGLVRRAAQGFRGQDSTNDTGSALLLLMLWPGRYAGLDLGFPAFWRLGFPPPAHVLRLDPGPIRSSVGPGNLRTNIIEALLKFWQEREPGSVSTSVREQEEACARGLEEVWQMLHTGLHLLRRQCRLDDVAAVPSWALLRTLMTVKVRRELVPP